MAKYLKDVHEFSFNSFKINNSLYIIKNTDKIITNKKGTCTNKPKEQHSSA